MSVLRNPKHERFAQEIAKGKTLEEAHRVAGYRADRRNAQHLRQRDDISRRIEELLANRDKIDVRATERAIERTAITKQRVIEELAKIGFANMADYTRLVGSERVVDLADASLDHLAAVQEIVVEDFKDGRGENARDVRRVKLKLHDKKGALVDIGRELGMFINRTEQGRPGEFDGLNREEMEQHLVDELVAGGIPEKTARAFIRARSPQ
jgi:phage terminase small subunit